MAHWLRRLACRLAINKRGRDSFARNIADDQSEPFPAQVQKVVVIAANLPRLDAHCPRSPAFAIAGSVCGNSLACTCFAISSS